jgi:DNA-binding FadR family transcriptional regulator
VPQDGWYVRSMAGALHDRVLDAMGARIVGRELPAGTVIRSDSLEAEYEVSRSVVREALRVLQSLGLVQATQRVGIRVQPWHHWNLYDPRVIRWRLASPDSLAQLRSLTELRCAIEPQAAALAAQFGSPTELRGLVELAEQMRVVGGEGRLDEFLELDIDFHRRILDASGNEMFAQLDDVIAEVLAGRTSQGLMPDHPHEEALQLHVDVAAHIRQGRSDDARHAMSKIMFRALAELEELWRDVPRPRAPLRRHP